MPEFGMGANNDRAVSSSSYGSYGSGSDEAANDSGGTTADSLAASPTTAEQLASSTSVLDSLTAQSQRHRSPEPASQGGGGLQSSSSASTQTQTNAVSAPADDFTQEFSDTDSQYSLPATPGYSAQDQDNPPSLATTADVSNSQADNDHTATPARPVLTPLDPAPRPPELAAATPPQSAAESFDALFADFSPTPIVTPGTGPFSVQPPMAPVPADEAENSQLHTDSDQADQTPIIAAGVATTAPIGWSIGGLWQGIAGVGQWVLNNAVRPLATTAGATAGTIVSGGLAMVYPRPLGGVHVVDIVGSDGVSVHITEDASVSVYQNGVFTGVPASLHPGGVVSFGGNAYQVEGSQASEITGNSAEPGPGGSAVPLEPPVQDPGAIDIASQALTLLPANDQSNPGLQESSADNTSTQSTPLDSQAGQDTPQNPATPSAGQTQLPSSAAQSIVGSAPASGTQTMTAHPGAPMVLTTPIVDPVVPDVLPGAPVDSVVNQPYLNVVHEQESSNTELPIHETDPADLIVTSQMSREDIEASLDQLVERYPEYTRGELEALVREPDGSSIRSNNFEEANAALAAEAQGIVSGPVRPSDNVRHDFEDAQGQKWDVKSPRSKYEFVVGNFVDKMYGNDIRRGENVLINTEHMTEVDIKSLEHALQSDARFENRYEFVPRRTAGE